MELFQLWNVRYRIKRKDGKLFMVPRPGFGENCAMKDGNPLILLGLMVDISEIHSLEEDLNKNAQLLTLIMKNNPATIVMVDSVKES
jgi:hypothetical protein